MSNTERLAIKILDSDKATLERMAKAEGESVAVVVRKILRRAVREFMDAENSDGAKAAMSAEMAVSNAKA